MKLSKLYTIIPIILSLTACGGGAEELPNWKGGLYGVWEAENPKGVIILHQGHNCFDACLDKSHNLIPVAEKFQTAGYTVYGFEMPPAPHDNLSGPVERYYQPVLDFLNIIGQPVYMVGLSGGGWVTAIVTALDSRIIKGFSIEGDYPEMLDDRHHFEQRNPPFGDYQILYQMAGDRLIHIWTDHSETQGYESVIDPTTDDHRVTDWTIDYILSQL